MNHGVAYLIIYGAANLFRIYVLFRFMQFWFQEKKVSTNTIILLHFLYFVLNTGCFALFHETLLNLLTNILPFFLITFLYETKTHIRVLTTAMIYAVSIAWDGATYALSRAAQTESVIISSGAATALMIFLSELIIEHIVQSRKIQKQMTMKLLSILVIPTGSILIGVFTMQPEQFESQPKMIVIECCILLLMNVIVFIMYDLIGRDYEHQKAQAILQNQNEAYIHQIQLMEQAQQRIRFLKHDMKNHFSQIRILAQQNDKERILSYLAEAECYVDASQEFIESHNPEIDSILNLKLAEAQSLGVKVHTDIQIPKEMQLSSFDMNIILGNLLDNALNALKPCTEKRLYVKIQYDSGILYLIVRNDYLEQKKHILPETDHGLGLLSVQNTVEQYAGRLVCSKKDHIYTAEAMLYLDSRPIST